MPQKPGPDRPGRGGRKHGRSDDGENRQEQPGNDHSIQCGRYSGTRIGIEPCAAFSALKIHTSPPNAPTIKDTAPNSSEMLTPSLVISPAYPNARPIVASRTPQPAIEIGSMVISMTGGTSWKIWPNTTGASIDCTTHQAMTTVSTCTSNDSTTTFGPWVRLNSTRLAMTEQ